MSIVIRFAQADRTSFSPCRLVHSRSQVADWWFTQPLSVVPRRSEDTRCSFSPLVAALCRHGKICLVPQVSAGLLMYRYAGSVLEVFLVHPGGPFWAGKDEGTWSIPKGLIDPGEDSFEAAKREFEEETSISPSEPFICLGEIRQKSGKRILAWAFQGRAELPLVKSNFFTMEWPPHSGVKKDFPEIDKGEFFSLFEARRKIHRSQEEFLDRLENLH